MPIFLFVALLVLCVPASFAQAPDTLMQGELDPIVVTATRTERQLEDVPVPTMVVGRSEIQARGAVRLPEILAGQTGLMLHYDHGTGVQMQGLGPEYTSILVDGVRLIGRTAGTLELSRITLNNVERIEIIRGPSSSLYGSEALAGVVNIITARPDSAFEGSARIRYGTHETSNASAYLGRRQGRFSGSIFMDRYASNGYDLNAATIAPTGPAFTDYTVQTRLQSRLSKGTTVALGARTNLQNQSNPLLADVQGEDVVLRDRTEQMDWNLAPSVTQRMGEVYLLTGRAYVSRFSNDNQARRTDDDTIHLQSDYDQTYVEGEATVEGYPIRRHYTMAGAGYIDESVNADRVEGRRRTFYAFAQDEWTPLEQLEVVLSARFDAPSDYTARLSPKAALLYRPNETWRARLSVGSGYKAPDFRQLYLDFTNPTVGYSVLGAANVRDGLARLEQEGQVADVLTPDLEGGALESESSVAFNAEFSFRPTTTFRARLGLFRNNVENLIDTRPVAVKHNGQQVFTYSNLSRVFTQGLEAEVSLRVLPSVSVQIGYQYLDTADRGVLDRIESGELFTRVDGRDRRMTRDDYGGLMQRSRHQATVQVVYEIEPLGLTAMVTSRLRSRYGFADQNGNGVLDIDAEYVAGYAIWNLSLSKDLRHFVMRAGIDNFTGVRPEYVPALSGARWFGALEFNL